MRDTSIARNYAEALLALARKANAVDEWGGLIHSMAGSMEADPRIRLFMIAPQVSSADKRAVLGKGLAGKAPPLFIKFLQKLVSNRRQLLIPHIATEFTNLVDEEEGRVHARVTVARAISDADRDAIAASLAKAIGKEVVPHAVVNPAILGGVVVRIGDTVMDGSVRRRLGAIRSKMLGS